MTSPLDRVKALLARATHPETPLEEARSCALLACKEIASQKLLEESAQRKPASLFALEAEVLRLSLKVLALEKERERRTAPPVVKKRKWRGGRGVAVRRALTDEEAREFGGVPAGDWADIDRKRK